ncbi:hypothetical protein DSECCO2_415660 [anaerobic digester metagenome]
MIAKLCLNYGDVTGFSVQHGIVECRNHGAISKPVQVTFCLCGGLVVIHGFCQFIKFGGTCLYHIQDAVGFGFSLFFC